MELEQKLNLIHWLSNEAEPFDTPCPECGTLIRVPPLTDRDNRSEQAISEGSHLSPFQLSCPACPWSWWFVFPMRGKEIS